MKSIFELENRNDLIKEFEELEADFKDDHYVGIIYEESSVYKEMEAAIKDWPYRENSNSIESYLRKKGILEMVHNPSMGKYQSYVYRIELYYNLIIWCTIRYSIKQNPFVAYFEPDTYHLGKAKRFLDNIEYILEKSNLSIREEIIEDNAPRFIIHKRDSDVDATLEIIPEISDLLLGYLDIRNSNDLEYKKNTLISLYGFIEPNEKHYKNTTYSKLLDSVKYAFNKFSIRHNAKDQIKLSESETIQMYDKLFYMCLQLIRSDRIKEYIFHEPGIKAENGIEDMCRDARI